MHVLLDTCWGMQRLPAAVVICLVERRLMETWGQTHLSTYLHSVELWAANRVLLTKLGGDAWDRRPASGSWFWTLSAASILASGVPVLMRENAATETDHARSPSSRAHQTPRQGNWLPYHCSFNTNIRPGRRYHVIPLP